MTEGLLDSLMDEERKRATLLDDEARLANERLKHKIAMGRKRRSATDTETNTGSGIVTVDDSQLVSANPLVSQVVLGLAAQHLSSLSAQSLSSMTVAQVQHELTSAGVDIDLRDMWQSLSDIEAAQSLAAKKAADDAELAFVRKLLSKQSNKMTKAEHAQLVARESALTQAINETSIMLAQIVDEQVKHRSQQQQAEDAAQQKMLEKLQKGKMRKKARELEEAQSTSVRQNLPLMAQILATVSEHCDIDASSLAAMPAATLQATLTSRGVAVDIDSLFRAATDSEAATMLVAKRAADEAELRMIRKMLARKNLNDTERANLLDQEKLFEASLALTEDLMSAVLDEQQKRYTQLSEQEHQANERMREKLGEGQRVAKEVGRSEKSQ